MGLNNKQVIGKDTTDGNSGVIHKWCHDTF